jgi:hypothetical protein
MAFRKAAVRRALVVAVFCPPRAHDLDTAVRVADRELKRADHVARADLVQQACGMLRKAGRPIEIDVDVLLERVA